MMSMKCFCNVEMQGTCMYEYIYMYITYCNISLLVIFYLWYDFGKFQAVPSSKGGEDAMFSGPPIPE